MTDDDGSDMEGPFSFEEPEGSGGSGDGGDGGGHRQGGEHLPGPPGAGPPGRGRRGGPPGRPGEEGERGPAVIYPSEAPYVGAYDYEDEVGLGEIFQVLRRRRWWVVLGFLLAFGAAAAWTWLQVPEWQASTMVRVEDGQGGRGTGGSGPGQMVLPLFTAGSQIQTEMRVVTTRPTLEPVVDQLDLNFRLEEPETLPRSFLLAWHDFGRNTPGARYTAERTGEGTYRLRAVAPETLSVERSFAPGDTVSLPGGRFVVAGDDQFRDLDTSPPEAFVVSTTAFDRTVSDLAEDLSVNRPDPEANLFRVSYTGTDRYLVRTLLNAVGGAYLERRQDVQNTKARSTVAFLRDQIDRVESELDAAESELQDFREAEQVVAPEAMAESQVEQLASLRAERTQLSAERDALQSLLNSIRDPDTGVSDYRRVASFPSFLQNQAVQNILQTLTEAEQRRTAMLERRTRQHPDVVTLTEQIDALESQLGEIARNYLSSLNDQVASLDAQLTRYGEELEQVPGEQLQLARLDRRTTLLTELHTMLQKRLKEAEIAEAVEDPSVRVVESAVLPMDPVAPKPMRNLALGGFLGLMLGVGLAFVREYTDRSIHTDEDVDEHLGLPVLSRVPRLPGAKGRDERRRGEALVAHTAGKSLPAESFRTLRTNVRYARAGNGVTLLSVTSPGAKEGKSTTAGNLAITFAQQGKRTLLLDADLRKPVQHAAFEVKRTPGLSDYLIGEAELRECVRVSEVENLFVFPAGSSAPNPAELLDSERMERLLDMARERFDAVVVDTPPALVVADASVVGRRMEGVLLVVRADKTDRRAASDTVEQLQRVDANVVGVVLNDAAMDGSYGYYKYRYYKDYYEDGDGAGAMERAKRDRWKKLLPFS